MANKKYQRSQFTKQFKKTVVRVEEELLQSLAKHALIDTDDKSNYVFENNGRED